MIGRLPTTLEVGGEDYEIRTDFRDCLLIMQAFQDVELTREEAGRVMLEVLYKEIPPYEQIQEAMEKAVWFLDCGNVEENQSVPKRPLYDFEQDEQIIFSAINKVAGKEVRQIDYLHWWTFIGYFNEIGEGTFSTVVSIRSKKRKNQKLEKWEKDFCRDNRKLVELKRKYTREELEELEKLDKLLGL